MTTVERARELRKHMTDAERLLWSAPSNLPRVRGRQEGVSSTDCTSAASTPSPRTSPTSHALRPGSSSNWTVANMPWPWTRTLRALDGSSNRATASYGSGTTTC